MFKWLKDKGQESLKNQFKFIIEDCSENLSKSLNYYYDNYFLKNISETQSNRTGIERFYLYMSAAFGYLHTDINKFAIDDELVDYFAHYIPLRITKKIDEQIGKEVFKGYDLKIVETIIREAQQKILDIHNDLEAELDALNANLKIN